MIRVCYCQNAHFLFIFSCCEIDHGEIFKKLAADCPTTDHKYLREVYFCKKIISNCKSDSIISTICRFELSFVVLQNILGVILLRYITWKNFHTIREEKLVCRDIFVSNCFYYFLGDKTAKEGT